MLSLILGGLSAKGSLATGGSQIAKAVNQSKMNDKLLQKTKNNEIIENKLITGKNCNNLYKTCKSYNGKSLFLEKTPLVR